MTIIPRSHLDVNSIQERIDNSNNDWFRPSTGWILAVICRAGFSFTCRGIFYWLTIWLIQHYHLSQWEAQTFFIGIAVSSPIFGVIFAGKIGDFISEESSGRTEYTLYYTACVALTSTFCCCVVTYFW